MDPGTLSYLSIGSLGTGFGEESLERGLAMGVDFIGADAGSVDGGPRALAGGPPAWSDAAYRRDLSLLLRASRRAGVPAAGRFVRPFGARLGRRLLRGHGPVDRRGARPAVHLTRIYSEIQPELVVERLAAGRVHAIDPAPPYDAAAPGGAAGSSP